MDCQRGPEGAEKWGRTEDHGESVRRRRRCGEGIREEEIRGPLLSSPSWPSLGPPRSQVAFPLPPLPWNLLGSNVTCLGTRTKDSQRWTVQLSIGTSEDKLIVINLQDSI